jgi:MFS transporter, FHS family, Na+ dependent glucose transporter 1
MFSLTPKNQKALTTIALYLSFLAMAVFNVILGATLPNLAQNTGASIDQVSILFSALFLGYILGAFFSGEILDRFHPLRILFTVILIGTGSLFIVPRLTTLIPLISAFFLMGLCAGTLDLGANLSLLWCHGERARPYLNGLHTVFGVGAFLTPLLIGRWLSSGASLQNAYWNLAFLLLPICLFLLVLSRWPFERNQGLNPQKNRFLGGKSGISVNLMLFALILMAVVGSGNSFSGWILTYTQNMFPAAPEQAAYQAAALFWIVIAITRTVTIPLTRRMHNRTILLTNLIGVLLAYTSLLVFANSFAYLWAGVALSGIMIATVFPTVLSYSSQLGEVKGTSTRWLYLGAGIGNVTLPWLVGRRFESFGPPWMHVVHISAAALGLLLLFILLNRTRHIHKETP